MKYTYSLPPPVQEVISKMGELFPNIKFSATLIFYKSPQDYSYELLGDENGRKWKLSYLTSDTFNAPLKGVNMIDEYVRYNCTSIKRRLDQY